ncbi:phytoene desaturase family protein [Candidatus Omnitrophota bacterium]
MPEKYDTIIVGAGIAGLVCGCYLAKAGLKVLIVERHSMPGGYCTSFRRENYKFDVGVHYLGSCRQGGQVSTIINELALNISLLRFCPTDKIILPNRIIYIRKDPVGTKDEFKRNFFKESKNIDNFFNFIEKKDFLSIYIKIKNLSFSDVLDNFFTDNKLKSAFSVLLGNIGLPSDEASALTVITLFREFILDGGYYPKGGVQVIPDVLVKKFKDYGGELLLSTPADKILTRNMQVRAIVVNGKESILADYIVVASDASNAFINLLDTKTDELSMVKKLSPSTSGFAIYLGLKEDISKTIKDRCTVWFFSTYDVNSCYRDPLKNILGKGKADYLICTFPSLHDDSLASCGRSTMGIFIGVPYRYNNLSFWSSQRDRISKILLNKAEELLPDLGNLIETKINATPKTFHKFTLNRNGAMYGWSSSMRQIDSNILSQETSIAGLILAGHWCMHGLGQGGVSVSAYSGRRAAKMIIKKLEKNNILYRKGELSNN